MKLLQLIFNRAEKEYTVPPPAQIWRIRPHFPLLQGVPRVDDRRVISGIVCVILHGLQWRDAPAA